VFEWFQKITCNGQVFAMAGQESSFADNQSSILFQKPNIRTDVQKSSSAPNRSQKKELKMIFIPSALLLQILLLPAVFISRQSFCLSPVIIRLCQIYKVGFFLLVASPLFCHSTKRKMLLYKNQLYLFQKVQSCYKSFQ